MLHRIPIAANGIRCGSEKQTPRQWPPRAEHRNHKRIMRAVSVLQYPL